MEKGELMTALFCDKIITNYKRRKKKKTGAIKLLPRQDLGKGQICCKQPYLAFARG
jgi:hypothetical protein